jgi:5-(carboxyamino)imidazole ribonucleotide mutase
MAEPKVLVVMGSDSDYEIMKSCLKILRKFEIGFECMVCSAHRTPDEAANLAKNAIENGFDAIIAAAGKSAHLPGVIAAYTTLPVIGVPIVSGELDGMDALLSIVQMPPGIPVASVAINGALNAGILACEILSLKYDNLKKVLLEYKNEMKKKVEEKNNALQQKIADL